MCGCLLGSPRTVVPPHSRSPVLLPNIRYLLVEDATSDNPYALDNLLRCIQAESLVTLALSSWHSTHAVELHFSSLQHLTLIHSADTVPDFIQFAQTSPKIETLTFKPGTVGTIYNILAAICGTSDGDRTANDGHNELMWPKLHYQHLGGILMSRDCKAQFLSCRRRVILSAKFCYT